MDKETFIDKVKMVAEHKYGLDPDVIDAFQEEVDFCWNNSFGAIRTVEFIAEKIF